MPAPVLQFKRGNAGVAGTVPALRPGEPAISLNNFDFFIGIDTSVANNKFFGSHRYWGREDGTNSLKLKLVDKDGTNYVAIAASDTLAGIATYRLPNTNNGSTGDFLKVKSVAGGYYDLEWSAIPSGSFTLAGDTGTDTFTTGETLTFAGTASEIETTVTNNQVQIGLPNNVVVGTSLSAPTIRTGTIQSSNTGATAITIAANDVTIADDLTVGGNLYVNGNTTQVNTTSMTVEDRTIELGVVDGSAPSSSTTWDLGVLFNYYDGSAKKSAVVWEQGDQRFKLGSVISDGGGTGNSNPQITFTSYAALEISDLWINNSCTGGSSQVIGCVGSELQLQNITVDAGLF